MASSAVKHEPVCDEIMSLLRGLNPCPDGEAVAKDRAAALAEVGGACRSASLVLPPPQQRAVRDAFVAWAGGNIGDESNNALTDGGLGHKGSAELRHYQSTYSSEQQARAQGLAAWRAFRPTSNWDELVKIASRSRDVSSLKDGDMKGAPGAVDPTEVLVFTRGAGDTTALLVPLSFCELDAESKLPRMSTKVETLAACIDATLQVGDLLGCASASPHLPLPAQVTAMWPQQHEVEVTPLAAAAAMVVRPGLTSSSTHGRSKRAHMAKGVTIRLSLTSLLGVDVVRPLAVASLDCEKHHKKNDNDEVEDGGYDDDDCLSSIEEKKKKGQKEKRLVCPAFTLPAADHAAALTLLQQRAARDAATRAEAILAAKKAAEEEPHEVAQRVRLLAALRASELRNRNEALRLLKLLDARRVSERTEWHKVGRALCAASPDLLGAWQQWTQDASLSYLSSSSSHVALRDQDYDTSLKKKSEYRQKVTSPKAPPPNANECEKVWHDMFRPPTTVDYGGGEMVLPASPNDDGDDEGGSGDKAARGGSQGMKAKSFQGAWTLAEAAKRDFLRFVNPSNGQAVAVNASVVRDAPSVFTAQPSAHLPVPSAVHVHQPQHDDDDDPNEGRFPAEVKVGDWVTTRSRVQLCFVRVVALDLDPRHPSITVAKPLNSSAPPVRHPPPGTSGWVASPATTGRDEADRKKEKNGKRVQSRGASTSSSVGWHDNDDTNNDEVQEVWHDLGLLWGAWIWRALPRKYNADGNKMTAANGAGLLWRLPCTDSTTGLSELNAMAEADAKRTAAEAAAIAAARARDPLQTNAYYTTQTLHVPPPASASAPKVVLVRRTADALTIGWALPKGTKLPANSDNDAVVEVLVRVLKGSDNDSSASSRAKDTSSSNMHQTALLSTVWNGDNSSSSGSYGDSNNSGNGSEGTTDRQKKSSQGSRIRNKLANGLVSSTSHALRDNNTANATIKPSTKRVANEWRELYRGDKNGCLVSQLSPGRTYSLRVRVGAAGKMTHVRLSTLPAPPPTPLVRKWTLVPRPNKDPRPSRERLLEVVLCGASAWHRHLQPPLTVQSQATAEAPKVAYHRSVPFIELALKEGTRGTGRTGGAFGNSSTRFHGLRGGAQNGGGVHSLFSSVSASAVSSAKRVSVLPEGWCYVVERHLLPPSVAAALEAEMENVLSGGVDDFFARNPILENDDVIARDAAAKSERARLYGAQVATSSTTSSGGSMNKLQLPWLEVCRTRSMIGYVTGIEASPPSLASSSPSQPPSTKPSKDMYQNSSVDIDDEEWPMTARELKLRRLKKQFEAGYLFKPMRFGSNSNDGNGVAVDSKGAAIKKTASAKQSHGSSASAAGSKRRIYVFRSFVESIQDPSVRSAPSALLVTEAPDASRAVAFPIAKPPADENIESLNEGGRDNLGRDSEVDVHTGAKDYDDSDAPFGEFGDFLNRLEHLVMGASTNFASSFKSGGEGSNHNQNEESHCGIDNIDDEDDGNDDDEEGLPLGWQAHWDEVRQLPYFSHATSGLVQWQRPVAWHAPTTP